MTTKDSPHIGELIGDRWIHAIASDVDGKRGECWCSPAREVEATCENNWIEYRDKRLRILYAYDAEEQTLYRVPLGASRRLDRIGSFALLVLDLRSLLQDEELVEKPLERLAFLVPEHQRGNAELIHQKLERVTEGGREWLDYHLTVRIGEMPGPLEFLFRVARETKLLHFSAWRFQGGQGGGSASGEMRFEYPAQGPADVYDLGVPKTAKLIDRTSSKELAQILEIHRADRLRMDDYRAFMIQRSDVEAPPQVVATLRDHLSQGRQVAPRLCRVEIPGNDADRVAKLSGRRRCGCLASEPDGAI